MTLPLSSLLAWTGNQVPVPHDIPLPLPADRGLIVGVLIALFLVHLFFVNLMLGGALLTAFFQGRSIRKHSADDDLLAWEIAKTITVNKSLAVVLGVAPLLVINVMYTIPFYSANALTGTAWISVVPLATAAFLLLYLHKYTWHTAWAQRRRRLHHGILLLALVPLLGIPLVFLTNINLMLFPGTWTEVRGFFSAMFINANVLPRYAHFLLASLALAGLFMAWYVGRPAVEVEGRFQKLTRSDLQRRFFRLAAATTTFQFVAGPIVLVTLPHVGLSVALFAIIGAGALTAVVCVVLLVRESKAEDRRLGKRLAVVVVLLGVVVLCMANGRHMYREKALVAHGVAVQKQTQAYLVARDAALEEMRLARAAAGTALDGKSLFQTSCATCHALDRVLAAPPVTELAQVYRDSPEGIVAWAKKPGRKRTQFAPMPSMAHIGDEKLAAIAQYMLQAASGTGTKAEEKKTE